MFVGSRKALLAAATFAGFASFACPAPAQPEYPQKLQQAFAMGDCVPQCVLCHTDPQGGGSRNAWGNMKGTAAAIVPQDAMFDLDFDGDLVSDRAELNAGSNPGDRASTPSSVVGSSVYSVCIAETPQYGCGARFARGNEVARAGAWLLIVSGALVMLTRRAAKCRA